MLIRLLSLSSDLRRLANEGYHLAWVSGHLLVKDVPYVTPERKVLRGTLIVKVEVSPKGETSMADHTIFFATDPAGITPCDQHGQPLMHIGNNAAPQQLAQDLRVDRRFSAKPPGDKYPDVYTKVKRYVDILGSSAFAIDQSINPLTHPVYADDEAETPFLYMDTASTRAEIMVASQKLEDQVVSIIGLGGCGSYVLDQVAKTPVREIRLFDADDFHTHNAFRAPGAASTDEIAAKRKKVEYFADVYSRMKRNVVPFSENVTEANIEKLEGSTQVFLCIDRPAAKPPIIAFLRAKKIRFTDVGMGLRLPETSITGSLQVITVDESKHDHLDKISTADAPPGIYAAAIQVADLNALLACLAVIKWKKKLGFYVDEEHENASTYSVRLNEIFNEDQAHPA